MKEIGILAKPFWDTLITEEIYRILISSLQDLFNLGLNKFAFREQADIELATQASVRDEMTDQESEEESTGDDAGGPSLMCGVSKCPQSETVWDSKKRLEKHR